MTHIETRRRFLATLAAAPTALAGSRWLDVAAAAPGDATPSVPAEQGLQLLLEGNQRFVNGALRSLNSLIQDSGPVDADQRPFAVIVCCSDSRVPPEIVFDQPPGQLFVVRTAGQVVDEAARSSIMYGTDYLGAPLVLVLGHSKCGAVDAALAAIAGNTIPGYAFRLAEGIGPAVQTALDQPGDQLDNAIRANISLGVEQLRGAEPVLAADVRGGRVTIVGGYYDLASGEVSILS